MIPLLTHSTIPVTVKQISTAQQATPLLIRVVRAARIEFTTVRPKPLQQTATPHGRTTANHFARDAA